MNIIRASILILLLITCNYANAGNIISISSKEKQHLEKAYNYIKDDNFKAAQSEALKSGSQDIINLIKWLQYRTDYKGNKYEDISAFLQENPNWPSEKLLRNRAEAAISSDIHSYELLKYFKNSEPITGRVMKMLADAKLSVEGDSQYVTDLIRQAWIQGDFTNDEEEALLDKHSKRLRQSDHIKRIDRLLWQGKTYAAKSLIGEVNDTHKRLFTARIMLMEDRRGMDKAIAKVPKNMLNNPGFLYARIKWHQKRRNYDRMLEYIVEAKGTLPHQYKWWDIKTRLIRELLEEKKYRQAYNIAKEGGNEPGGADYAEEKWLAGWIALSFLNQPRAAYEHFYDLYQNVSFPVSRSRGAYWAARAAAKNGNSEIAKKWYRLAANHTTTFYGQLAALEIGAEKPLIDDFPKLSPNDKIKYQNNSLLRTANLLAQLEQEKTAQKFIIAAINNAKNAKEMAVISLFGQSIGRRDLSVVAAKYALRKNVVLKYTGWPVINTPAAQIEKDFILSIIRQESSFDPEAVSPANAAGLMQLIPGTAKRMSHQLKLRYDRYKLIKDPEYNMKLGSHYLAGLVDRFDGSYILAICSYNAGPTNANRWISTYGDPRKLKTHEEVLDWIESIPFSETRNYVQRVLENLQVYRHINGRNHFQLQKDLLR